MTAELLLSGRLVPMELMPPWVQTLSTWLPFRWTFQGPIDIVIGRVDGGGAMLVLAAQMLWIAGLGLLLAIVWKRAVRRYAAVGA